MASMRLCGHHVEFANLLIYSIYTRCVFFARNMLALYSLLLNTGKILLQCINVPTGRTTVFKS